MPRSSFLQKVSSIYFTMQFGNLFLDYICSKKCLQRKNSESTKTKEKKIMFEHYSVVDLLRKSYKTKSKYFSFLIVLFALIAPFIKLKKGIKTLSRYKLFNYLSIKSLSRRFAKTILESSNGGYSVILWEID